MCDEYIEIRCPKQRAHGQYERCGHLIGGYNKQCIEPQLFFCAECSRFWKVYMEDGAINMNLLPTNKINMLHTWKFVADK